MCFFSQPRPAPAARIAAPSSDAARRQGDLEARLRRRRAGAAADVLTTPLGLVPGAAQVTGAAA